MDDKLQERIIIAVAIILIGIIIGYNAFYVPAPAEPVIIYGASQVRNNETVINDNSSVSDEQSDNNFQYEEYDANSYYTSDIVNINTATSEQLQTLDGIGESRALKIIEYRENNGNFKSIEELMEVEGVGEGIFNKIKDYITV